MSAIEFRKPFKFSHLHRLIVIPTTIVAMSGHYSFAENLGDQIPLHAALKRDYRPHSGYLSSITSERDQTIHPVVVFTPPPPQGPRLFERIFNEKLNREFVERYNEKFGRTEQLRVFNSPNRLTYYDDPFGFRGTAEENNEAHRKFGEFMLRRLSEYHLETYAKNEPNIRPVWNAKERISQVNLRIGDRITFHGKYSISANSGEFKVSNPFADVKITLQLGAGTIEETTLSLARTITPSISAESHFALTDGIVSFIGRKGLTPNLGLSATTSTFTHNHGKTVRQSLYVAGLSYIF